MSSNTHILIDDDTVTIKFNAKPCCEQRNALTSMGFLWHPSDKVWAAPATPERKSFAEGIEQDKPDGNIIEGDCIQMMQSLDSQSIDLVVTDPPYLVNYRDRSGRSIQNDNDAAWVAPAFDQIYRLLKSDRYFVSFCGWSSLAIFVDAAKAAGFRAVGQIVWQKEYAASSNIVACHHEQAMVFAKGRPQKPSTILPSVLPWSYSGNRLHPTQKHVDVMSPLVEAFSRQGGKILDPFCGSGSTLVAAHQLKRSYIGIEMETAYVETARRRIADMD